jgi:hypothetical protein
LKGLLIELLKVLKGLTSEFFLNSLKVLITSGLEGNMDCKALISFSFGYKKNTSMAFLWKILSNFSKKMVL